MFDMLGSWSACRLASESSNMSRSQIIPMLHLLLLVMNSTDTDQMPVEERSPVDNNSTAVEESVTIPVVESAMTSLSERPTQEPARDQRKKRARISYAPNPEGSSDEESVNDQVSEFEAANSSSDDQVSASDTELDSVNEMEPEQPTPGDNSEEDDFEDTALEFQQSKPAIKRTPSTKSKSSDPSGSRRELNLNVPPIDNIRDIFSDITRKAIGRGFETVSYTHLTLPTIRLV